MSGPDDTIQFVEAYRPPMAAGPYTLTVTQVITELEANSETKSHGALKTYTTTRKVYVQGQRFSIDPLDITSVSPPDGSEGDYGRVLPHITFSRKTLPWEHESGVSNAPWLALLVFRETDPGGIPPIRPAMVGDLMRVAFRPGESLSLAERPSTLATATATYADAAKAAGRTWALRPGENAWDSCLVVDVPVPLFREIAPTQGDLGWLAHARIVSTPPEKAREFSGLLANRLPMTEGASMACLVSLEGMGKFLAPESNVVANDQRATHVRLVVLKAWNFRCSTDRQGFHRPLSTGPLKLPYTEPRPEAATPEDAKVKNILAMGYTALDHGTRWGDRTISWYRGPLLPFSSDVSLSIPLPPICEDGYLTGTTPLSTADRALRYDPTLGMLDVSYAAAWQLGRLMALGDKTFSYDLYQWKREIRRKIIDACTEAERSGRTAMLARSMPGEAPAAPRTGDPTAAFAFLAGLMQPVLEYLASRTGKPAGETKGSAPTMNPMLAARSFLKDRDKLKKILQGARAPDSVVNRLGKLRRLEGVPLDYLVPDERMLPPESLRFFQVDLNWIYSLIEGAYSVARVSIGDQNQDTATCPHDTYRQISGFLLRSAIVSGWPGLQVQVEVSNDSAVYRTLRCERLTPDILLYLVEVEGHGIVTSVTFQVPPESLEFRLPENAAFRDGGRSVVDVQALAQGASTAAEFALKLAPPVVRPALTWNDERDILSLKFQRVAAMDHYQWQFLVNGRPFRQLVPFTVPSAGPTWVETPLPLVDDLPEGEIAVRVRSTGPPPSDVRGHWVTSTALHRPPAYDVQPVLGYHVGDDGITAAWPAPRGNARLAALLLYTPPGAHETSPVGRIVKVDSLRSGQPLSARLRFSDGLQPGKIQVRFRSVPIPTNSSNLPGVWGTSTQALTRLSGPIMSSETSYIGGVLKLRFFDQDSNVSNSRDNTLEAYLTTREGSPTNPICTVRGTGRRVDFTVKPEDAPPGRYWVMARVIGRDNDAISSPVLKSPSQVTLLGRPALTVSTVAGKPILSWSRIDDAVIYYVALKDDRGSESTASVEASPAPSLDLLSQRLPPGRYQVLVQAMGARGYVWTGPWSDPAVVIIDAS